MDMTRESKLKNAFATPLLNNISNKVTEKEPIVGDNKGIFTHLKTVNCDNYCSSTYMIFSSIHYKIMTVTEHKIIKVLASFSGKHCLFFKLVTPKVIL